MSCTPAAGLATTCWRRSALALSPSSCRDVLGLLSSPQPAECGVHVANLSLLKPDVIKQVHPHLVHAKDRARVAESAVSACRHPPLLGRAQTLVREA